MPDRIPPRGDSVAGLPPADYCRAVEAYLCRKNDGHLIRIVGPSFDLVCGWAARGVPLRVAQRGIDRCFERYYAKGPRRHPVRIDFCEADVLDVFDEWRRAVGVPLGHDAEADAPVDESDTQRSGRHTSLPAHLDRACARLAALRDGPDSALGEMSATIARELEGVRQGARGLRGRGRQALKARLSALDSQLMAAARRSLTDADLEALRRDAEGELAHFRGRMMAPAFEQAVAASVDRLLRERLRLPTLEFE